MTHEQRRPAENLSAKLPQRVTGFAFSDAGDLLVAADSGGNLLLRDLASPSAKGRRCRIPTPKMAKKSVSIILAEKAQKIFVVTTGVKAETPSQTYGFSDVGERTILHSQPLQGGRPLASDLKSLGTLCGLCPVVAMDDGRRVAVGGEEITIHDAADPDRSKCYPFPRFATALAAGAKETLYVGDTHGGITAWTPKSSKLIVHPGDVEGPISAMAFSANGRRLAFASGNSLCVVDVGTGKLRILHTVDCILDSVFFGHQDQELFCFSSKYGLILRWRIDRGSGGLFPMKGFSAIAVSRDGRHLAVGGNKGAFQVVGLDEELPTVPLSLEPAN